MMEKRPAVWTENEEKKKRYQGLTGPIGREQVSKFYDVYDQYYRGKTALNDRIRAAENWYKERHWKEVTSKEDEPSSGYLFNAVINKHADAMDNYPAANVLPREESDKDVASALSKIVTAILERCQYEKTYSDCQWSKLKTGTSATGVFWNKHLDNGLGDVDVKEIDMMNLYWQPGIDNIQKSRYLFITKLIDNEVLMETYDFLESPGVELNPEASYDTDDYIDKSDKTTIIDCYYKKRVGTREVVHYVKFIPGHLLYASENDEIYAQEGFYSHGKYPVVLDVMFPEKDSPAGFGYVDIMKEPQMYIDKMDGIILRHAIRTGKPRILTSDSLNINEEELKSDSDVIHVAGPLDEMHFRQLTVSSLDGAVYNRLQGKIEELKETSGNTDYSQGNSTGGVTAASAIAALQEASSKLSRDMIRQSYTAHTEIVNLVIENIRQFYDEARSFRVLGPLGEVDFIQFDNHQMGKISMDDVEARKPIYDIKVSSQKASPYTKVAQNELAKELFKAGIFNPELADQALMMLEMMDFDGKETLIQKVSSNAKLFRENQALKEQMAKMATIIDAQNGTNVAQNMIASFEGGQQAHPGLVEGRKVNVDALGKEQGKNNIVARAKAETANRTNPE